MANIKDRPYVGTWSLDGRKLVQHTPDALVYVNGEATLPRCKSCEGRISLQKFITEVSVEAGTDPAGASASFTMAVPLHSSDAFARDAKFLLHPGLEIHIYERGYFPVKGLFSNLAESISTGEIESAEVDGTGGRPTVKSKGKGKTPPSGDTVHMKGFQKRKRRGGPTSIVIHESGVGHRHGTEYTLLSRDTGVHYIVSHGATSSYGDAHDDVFFHAGSANGSSIGVEFDHRYHGKGESIPAKWYDKGKYTIPPAGNLEQLYRTLVKVAADNNIPFTQGNVSGNTFSFGAGGGGGGGINTHRGVGKPGGHSDGTFPALYIALRERGHSPAAAHQLAREIALGATTDNAKVELPVVGGPPTVAGPGEITPRVPEADVKVEDLGKSARKRLGFSGGEAAEGGGDAVAPGRDILSVASKETLTTLNTKVTSSLLERFGLAGRGIEDTAAYPYYHTFHGVVTQVSHSWSGGFQTITVQCASMLHFWEYHKLSTNMGITSQTDNVGNSRSIKGNNFVGWHPYQIMYHLHKMTFGTQMKTGDTLSKQVTNQSAVDPGTGRGLGANKKGLPSLTAVYWERRFDTSIVNLRMHGMSGALYSSLQSAYLSQEPSKRLSRRITNHFNRKADYSKLSAIVGLNLNNDRAMRGLTFSASSLAGPTPSSRKSAFDSKTSGGNLVNINMADVQAFVWQMSNTASWGLFENTYSSKLDIAQKVMEVTGFEFFQDVDGDLVFKPPMWNLDTSSSRVYRIENIDIISLSFDEKEPQCTYVVAKASQMSSSGVNIGLEAEMGKKTTYVDFRLVAKFGYRPFEFETAYIPDQRSMFYMAAARMDVINIGTHSASCTIPLRPEIRPGYPVYIPYLDCHYYIRSLSHSYSVGGQCTTTLQLVGKRSKFYAPGSTDVQGIDAIDFADTSLPQRPLEVQGKDGVPKLSGFPNVVMALDPEGINPLYYPTGADVSRLETDRDFRNFLRMASREGIGVLATQGDGIYTYNTVSGLDSDGEPIPKTVTFYFGADVTAAASGQKSGAGAAKAIPEGAIDIQKAATAYRKFTKSGKKKKLSGAGASVEKEIGKLDKTIAGFSKDIAKLEKAGAKAKAADPAAPENAELKALKSKRAQAQQQRSRWVNARGNPTQSALLASNVSDGVKLFAQLIEEFTQRFWVTTDQKSQDALTTHHLAQLLSNKKANFSNNSQPGSYRYYSASHPDPAEQGQPLITYRTPEAGGVDLKMTPQALDEDWADITVLGYVRAPDSVPGTFASEAKLEDVKPKRGMLVQTNKPGFGEVRPTSEIRTIMLSTQLVEGNKDAVDYKNTRTAAVSAKMLGVGIQRKLSVKGADLKPKASDTFKLFEETWDEIWAILWTGVLVSNRRFDAFNSEGKYTFQPPVFGAAFPGTVKMYKSKVATDKAASTFAFGPEPGATKISGMTKPETVTIENFFDLGGAGLTEVIVNSVSAGLDHWFQAMPKAVSDGNMSQEGVDVILTSLADYYASGFKVPISTGSGSKQGTVGKHKTTTWSTVFPISDAAGYEHTGSFQYGRGLDIEPGGVWDAIRSQDPLSILDRKTTDDIISAMIRGKTITVDVVKQLPGGKTVTEKQPLSGTAARGALERKALTSLRKNYSDQQLLDLGLLESDTEDPSKLKFNLMNWISTQKEGIHKLPVVNAAFSLADLTFQQEGKVCGCKAAEANSKIEAYGNEGFLSFAGGTSGTTGPTGLGTGDTDRATQWLITEAMKAAGPHKMQQDAMRGVALDKPQYASFDAFKSSFLEPAERLANAHEQNKAAAKKFGKDAKEAANQSFDNVVDEFGGTVDDDGTEQVSPAFGGTGEEDQT